MKKVKLAILASGNGTNAETIIRYFENHPVIEVAGVLCNKPGAGVIQRAQRADIPVLVFSKNDFEENGLVHQWLHRKNIAYLILAGFLWQVPDYLVKEFKGRIINIHPALLPAYGGKGMYGDHVHRGVLAAGEKESGITIHLVDEIYDHGEIIFQARCPIHLDDTPETLAQRIHELEHKHYPEVIEKVIMKNAFC
ncbi:MAG: phosphoribosylglycinamide formyltransferase 1 [Bacteroidales bacterium]|nr:phosphoribosylglycinamide formyltransferase 1 [Bacteroidales bacterium]